MVAIIFKLHPNITSLIPALHDFPNTRYHSLVHTDQTGKCKMGAKEPLEAALSL